jgi:hypothetical protein
MDGYLSNKPDNFVDGPEKLNMLRRREAQQAKMLDFVDSKSEDEGSLESLKNSPAQSPRENRLPPMGEQPQERKIKELCTPNIIDLPILNLVGIGRPFEIKTSTIRMVQHSPFTGKEDPNLHLQAFIQLCQTFNMDGVTQDQMRERLFLFSLLGKALQWFHSQPAEMVQNWNVLMRAFMKEYYSPVPEGGPHLKVLPRTHHGIKDDHQCISGRIYHQAYADRSFHSIQEGRGQ